MADTPDIGDVVLYRGRYREVIGWRQDTGEPITESEGPILAYQNPETERNTYTRVEDMAWSDHFGAWYPVGLVLSRAECVVYAAHPELPGGDVPQARQHETAARMLEDVDLDLNALSDADRETLERKIAGYWGEGGRDAKDVFAEARDLREHRQREREA